MGLGQLFYSFGFKENLIPHNKISIVEVRQDNSFVGDFVILLARKWNSRARQFDHESVLVNNFVVAFSQLSVNLHAKADRLEDFFFVEQFRHK